MNKIIIKNLIMYVIVIAQLEQKKKKMKIFVNVIIKNIFGIKKKIQQI